MHRGLQNLLRDFDMDDKPVAIRNDHDSTRALYATSLKEPSLWHERFTLQEGLY
jgi:hypothetical protein